MTKRANDPAELPWNDRGSFLNLAGGVEGGMVLLALGLAWLFELDLWGLVTWDRQTGVACMAGLLPMVMLFGLTWRWPVGPLQGIKGKVQEIMGPPLAACRWYDLVLLAAVAGLGEELLFRGVLQTGLDQGLGKGMGLVLASILFGLMHAVTPAYAFFAGGMGLYLGSLLYLWLPPNLLVPIIVHAVYDLIAFAVLRADHQRRVLSREASRLPEQTD